MPLLSRNSAQKIRLTVACTQERLSKNLKKASIILKKGQIASSPTSASGNLSSVAGRNDADDAARFSGRDSRS